jgi:hypothetical protein
MDKDRPQRRINSIDSSQLYIYIYTRIQPIRMQCLALCVRDGAIHCVVDQVQWPLMSSISAAMQCCKSERKRNLATVLY